MTITIRPPEPTLEQLRARAASGTSGVSKAAQRQLIERRTAELARELGR